MGVDVLQQPIDEKGRKMAEYRAADRADRLAPSNHLGGVWLLVTVFDGKGLSSSIWTAEAERRLRRRGFDRAFLLDRYQHGDRRMIEICEV